MTPETVPPSGVDFPAGSPLLAKCLGRKFVLTYRFACPAGMKPAFIGVDREPLLREVGEAGRRALLRRIASPKFAEVRRAEARLRDDGGESVVTVRIQTRTFLNPLAHGVIRRLRLRYVPVPAGDLQSPSFLCERRWRRGLP